MVYLRRNPKSLSPTAQSHLLLTYTQLNTSCLSLLKIHPSPRPPHDRFWIATPTPCNLLLRAINLKKDQIHIIPNLQQLFIYKIANEDKEYSLIGEIYQILCTQLLSILPVAVWQAPCGWLWLPRRPLFISPAGLLSRRPQ